MTRAEILADTIARLERERLTPLPPRPADATCNGPSRASSACPPISPEEAALNLQRLMAAVGDDRHLWALPEVS